MTSQPVPEVSRADVQRVVRRDFPPDREVEVFALLDEYGKEGWHPERDRVHLAALKLAVGSIERLRSQIEVAKTDYRDVIAVAEYPGYMKRCSQIEGVPPDEQQRIIDADWRQYHEWLAK
jgi:hypothetical protein